MKQEEEIPHIKIEEIVKAKLPKQKLPRFIIRYLQKIAHEDEVNYIFEHSAGLKNLDFARWLINHLAITYSIEGAENLPRGAEYIFASNHPLGGLDGVILGTIIGEAYDGKVKLMANDILSFIKPLQELFIPVNKVGSQAKENVKILNDFYLSDKNLITFPSGKCSRKTQGQIIDPEWQKNVIAKAVQYHRDIVPVYFEGKNSNFFYNLANLRKFLKIKVNIEMLYLCDELFKQRGSHFTVRFGKAIPWQTFDRSKTQKQWAEWLKEQSYAMKSIGKTDSD